MMLCPRHEQTLRAALTVRGLDHYCSDGEELVAKIEVLLDADEEDITPSTFEPFVLSSLAIATSALELVGTSITTDEDDGKPRCPICYLDHLHELAHCDCGASFGSWITTAANEMALAARAL